MAARAFRLAKLHWTARALGGQHLVVFSDEELIAVFTGWDLLNDTDPNAAPNELAMRVLPALKRKSCNSSGTAGEEAEALDAAQYPHGGHRSLSDLIGTAWTQLPSVAVRWSFARIRPA